MTVMLQAAIELASVKMDDYVKRHKTKGIKFSELAKKSGGVPFHLRYLGGSSSAVSSSSSSRPCLPVLTKSHHVRKDGDYGDMTLLAHVDENFSLTDAGLSRPKIIKCYGTDGALYMQLIKGGDDTRQDAVMQQVFEHVNVMLQTDTECSQRRLHIRTYRIIPLTPQTGIIEWVENTIPFGSYLCDSKDPVPIPGAHSRYHPSDITNSQARMKLENATTTSKEQTFHEICAEFHPAFRYFFLEMYSDPMEWLTNRITYTRTVSVTSMIGYILGIGDRHSHNILIDEKTAEIIHIDFGIMFEQGKALGTPETVPFRLTRDIIDGMGVNGTSTEGTYRKCCEIVLKLLRHHTSQLMTILEVVIHDPLYKWCLSPLQARNKQINNEITTTSTTAASRQNEAKALHSSSSSSADAAKRALLRIKGKLQGQEETSGETLSVEGQVEYLINEARDYKNLCKLFPGWAPWL
jgi:serine-protein kinase ATM